MSHVPQRPAVRCRTILILALSLASTLAAADSPVDELAATLTCSGTLDPVTDTIGDPAGLLDTSYCHDSSTVTTCEPDDETCTVEGQYQASSGTVDVSVTGTPEPGGFMFLALGRSERSRACDRDVYVDTSIRFESEGVGSLVATHRIAKAQDQETTQNGVENIGFCYSAPKPFTDRAGNTVLSGLLPDCAAVADVPPCVLQRKKNMADAIVTLLLPSGDPTWQMVEDTLDDYTG